MLALVVGALASQSPAGFCDSGPQPSRARPAASGPGSAQGLFEQILRRYGEYRDFQARFVETPISRASGEGAPESGLVSFKRPELWRWEYSFPEKKVVVVRGSTVFIAIEGEPEVSQYDLAEAGQEAGIGALLSGGEQVGRSFSARFDPSGSEKEPVLRLEPLQLSEQYDHVLVRVRRRDLTIREVVVVDPGGNRLRFQFDAFRTNLGLPQKLFDPPPAHPSR